MIVRITASYLIRVLLQVQRREAHVGFVWLTHIRLGYIWRIDE